MNLRKFDLNLLVVLDAILTEKSVTRGASRVGLTQSAASNALARARNVFEDPLLERAGEPGMRLTPKAQAMQEPLRAALREIEQVLSPAPFDLAAHRATIRIVSPDIPATPLAERLIASLAIDAPGIVPAFYPWRAAQETGRLDRNEIDIALTSIAAPNRFRKQALASFPYVVVMRRQHPAADGAMTRDEWFAQRHVIVSGEGESHGSIAGTLRAIGRDRQVGAIVPGFLSALSLVRATDLIATFPAAVLTTDTQADLTCKRCPLDLEPLQLFLLRHKRSDDDTVIDHVAGLIEAHVGAMETMVANRLSNSNLQ